MTVENLIKKLNKSKIDYISNSFNDLNKELAFIINNIHVSASYDEDKKIITDYSIVIGYDEAAQETTRRFFTSFKQVFKYCSK